MKQILRIILAAIGMLFWLFMVHIVIGITVCVIAPSVHEYYLEHPSWFVSFLSSIVLLLGVGYCYYMSGKNAFKLFKLLSSKYLGDNGEKEIR